MLIRGICLSVVLCFASCALAHGPLDLHEHVEPTMPLAEILSGAALVLASASLWVSVRTRRLIDERDERA